MHYSAILGFINIFLFLYLLLMFKAIRAVHPMVIVFYLVIISLLIGGFLLVKVSSWGINAIILIFLGGIIVLFIYISVLRNEDKMVMRERRNWALMIFLLLMSLICGFFSRMNKIEYFLSLGDVSFLFKPLFMVGFFFRISYLLLTLFFVVKVTESFKGSLMKTK